MDNNTQKFKFPKAAAWGIIFLSAVFYLVTILARPTPALATTVVTTGTPLDLQTQGRMAEIQTQLGVSNQDIRITIARIIRVAFGLVGIVFVVLIIYGGFLYMTAGGDERQIDSAKKIIINGAIGVFIMLAAFSITSFIISKLGEATTQGGQVNSIAAFDTNFFGSGALGGIIKDHYPGRNEINVPRNTRIIISFRRAVLPSSFITDTNNDGILGDCVTTGTFNWETSCDRLRLDPNIINITRDDTGEAIRGAAAMISYENAKAYTVTIRPYDALGSSSENIRYKVHIGNSVLLDDSANNNPPIFQGRSALYYEWLFTCSTALDTTPPHVISVYPDINALESRNTVVQINFSKPMDPTGLQGGFTAAGGYYVLNGNNIFVKSNSSTIPLGNFRLVNNYKTLEFTPSTACGQNACGGTVYCMPVCDAPGANCTSDQYQVLIKPAETYTTSSFESIPYTGAEDASGNALDGNNNGRVDQVNRNGGVFSSTGLMQPDSYFWNFSLQTGIDTTAPYIEQVVPGPEAQNVSSTSELSLLFSKTMRADSLYNIYIQEYPTPQETLCFVPRATFNANGTTYTNMEHCPFITSENHYYYPVVGSDVQDAHFNCFYPGMGPVGLNAQNQSLICDGNQNCCPVSTDPNLAFCCNGVATSSNSGTNCINILRSSSL